MKQRMPAVSPISSAFIADEYAQNPCISEMIGCVSTALRAEHLSDLSH